MRLAQCLCAHIPRIALTTRLLFVRHHRETRKPNTSGRLALAALVNSELQHHGLPDKVLDLHHLYSSGRRLLVLFPSEDARPLDAALLAEDPRPITLAIPDGDWRRARRISRRVAGLERAARVTLVRDRVTPRLATLEAVAWALGLVESEAAQKQLASLHRRWLQLAGSGEAEGAAPADKPASRRLAVLHQDEHLVAVNKPAGLIVHRGWDGTGQAALQLLRDQLGRYLYPVHRLDRATSGVLLFALRSEVARDLQAIFAAGEMHKRYLALCRGHAASLTQVDHPLAQDGSHNKRNAVTDFRLLAAFERYGWYEVRPRTGRTHQIRRHLKHVSQPIVGDVRYGKGAHNRLFRTRFNFHRMALHCHRMTFEHPRGAKRLSIEAPLDSAFTRLLEQLGLKLDS